MMRELIALVAAALLNASALAAQAPDLPPLPLRDKGREPIRVVRQYDIPHEKPNGGFSGQVCPIRFVDPYFGYLSQEEYGVEQREPVGIQCYDSDNRPYQDAPVRLDKEAGKWVRDMSGYYERAYADSSSLTSAERSATEKSIHVFSVTSVNARGFAVSQDDIMGEPRRRIRHFYYCLIKPPKALCGDGQVGQLANPKTDLTAYALQIIRSIEFLDDAPVAAQAASAASAPDAAASSPTH
jgi:hypothetical protein